MHKLKNILDDYEKALKRKGVRCVRSEDYILTMQTKEGFLVLCFDVNKGQIMRLFTAYSLERFHCSRQEMLEYFNLINRTSRGVKVSFYNNERVEFKVDTYIDDGIYYTDIFLAQAHAIMHCVRMLFDLTKHDME